MDYKGILIGIDYGFGEEYSVFTVGKRVDGSLHIIDAGEMKDFDFSKYVSMEHQIVGEPGDIKKFKEQFITRKDI